MQKIQCIVFSLCIIVINSSETHGQLAIRNLKGGDLNTINTAVPFITISPDAKANALGATGVATSPDVYSQHWNSAKYVFMDDSIGISLSYMPWLRKIIPDINHLYLTGYYKFKHNQAISASLRYFSLGQITFTNIGGQIQGQYRPFEMAFDVGYNRRLADRLAGGVVFRYIHSNLTSGQLVNGEESKPGKSIAGDFGLYYDNTLITNKDLGFAFGFNLSNLGTPIAYTVDADRTPIPANLRVGGRADYSFNIANSLSFNFEVNKLLVPTRPISQGDSIIRGYPEPSSIVRGMIQSFYDAPGISFDDGSYSSVLYEEITEVMLSTGIEYIYINKFAFRTGYFHESSVKGNRKYASIGFGVVLPQINIDLAYLIPANGQESPLANTIAISMAAKLNSLRSK